MPSNLQRQAIEHLSGPAMVIAGPGSGKTFTIVRRILNLVQNHHIPPDNILVITYTKAAANEMKERYEKAMSSEDPAYIAGGSVNFGTFHSICYHILKQWGMVKADSLIRERDKRKLFQVILGNNGFAGKDSFDTITHLQNAVSRMKNLGITALRDEEMESFPALQRDFTLEALSLIRKEYDCYLREQGLIDFDDMITECLTLLSSRPSALIKYQNLFQYILADEFQDINLPQYEILKLLAFPSQNLFVVGDDDQAIYGFRGATPGIMQQFLNDFRGGKKLLLTENYRSGESIVALAKQVIARNKERFKKEFYPVKTGGRVNALCYETRKEEEEDLVKRLSFLSREQLTDTAVIVRTNLEGEQYGGILKACGIGVKGVKATQTDIFHGFIMEDIAAFLSYLYEGGRRGDLLHFMNKPNRFFTRMALPEESVSLRHMEQYYCQNPQMLREARLFFRHLEIASGLQPHLAIAFFRKTLGYDRYLHEQAKDRERYEKLLAQAEQIQRLFKEYKGGQIRDFISSQAEKNGKASLGAIQEKGVSILTMHGAKGLEFARVFLPDVNEGVIPGRDCTSPSQLEEERRLLYVAMTRAKEELFICYTKERGRKLSPYLQGIIPHP